MHLSEVYKDLKNISDKLKIIASYQSDMDKRIPKSKLNVDSLQKKLESVMNMVEKGHDNVRQEYKDRLAKLSEMGKEEKEDLVDSMKDFLEILGWKYMLDNHLI